MIKRFQQLTARPGRDKIEIVPVALKIIWAVFAPFEFLAGLAVIGLVRTFSGTMQNGVGNRFDDPVYQKNLQRLIERNRQFEEERNDRHS
jgi:hypothetical protein